MAINIISKIKPKNNGQFPVADDVDILGGYQIRENTTDRDSIPLLNRKEGMLVYSKSDDKYYTLSGGLSDGYWIEVILGGGGGSSRSIVLIDEPTTYNVPAGENQLIICSLPFGALYPLDNPDIIINLPEEPVIMQEIIVKINGFSWDGVDVIDFWTLVRGNHNIDYYPDWMGIDLISYSGLMNSLTMESLRIRWTGIRWSIISWINNYRPAV